MNITLTPTLEQFIKDLVASGLYSNASEVIREGLRGMISDRDKQLQVLRQQLKVGIDQADQGLCKPFDITAFNQSLDATK